jgi:hypothetical protein
MLFKKIFTILTVVSLIISLSACGKLAGEKGSVKPELGNSWTVDSTIKYGNLDATAKITRNEKNNWDVEFASPNSLSGVRLSFNGDDVNASYKGLSFSVPKSALPYKTLLGTLFTAVDDLAEKDNIKGGVKDGIVTIEGKADSGNYKLGLDAKTGNLKTFEVPDYKATVQFENMTADGTTDDAVLTTVIAEDVDKNADKSADKATDKDASADKNTDKNIVVTKEAVNKTADIITGEAIATKEVVGTNIK